MKYENVSFNTKAILKYKPEQLAKRFAHLWPKVDNQVRKDRLKEVYKLAKIHENVR